MGTEILQSQDVLLQRSNVATPAFHRRRNLPIRGDLTNLISNRRPSNTNSNSNYSAYKKKSPKSDKRKPIQAKRVNHGGDAKRKDGSGGGGGLEMGQVTILRRGQSYDSLAANLDGGERISKSLPKKTSADDVKVLEAEIIESSSSKNRLSAPRLADEYAGSVFLSSPSPRSLPLPSFCNRKQQDCAKMNPSDPATMDLRRLLRLE